jgi:signal transduction histidine kinase
LHQLQPVELVPSGLGARQLNHLYQELGVAGLGALLIEPLAVENRELGVLLLAGPPDWKRWPSQQKRLTRAVADFLALAIGNARLKEKARNAAISSPVDANVEYAERLAELEHERDRALSRVASSASRRRRAEAHLASETQRVSELTLALTAAEYVAGDTKVKALEDEVASLRKSLGAAEEALSLATRDGANLSADWVTRTVTRYSGDLEDANERINHLEAILVQTNELSAFELIGDHARQLRTPLTSLAGYTELLLGESLGLLGSKQMILLRRMNSNIETVARSLDRIAAIARQGDGRLLGRATTDTREAIESAARAMETQLQARRLSLKISLADALPPVPSDNDAFFRIVVLLLRNACQVSTSGSRLMLSAKIVCIEESGPDKDTAPVSFLHLAITDTGAGQTWELHAKSLESHHLKRNEEAERVEEANGLTEALWLIASHGGRTWVDQLSSSGCAFSVLLPISIEGQPGENCA